ncbi:hypothetical protein [Streptomyces niveus]|uniref:hypothetical protein n=1 Tax=Streptomyces niveus TaxID=193462 RepID=UPI0003C60644|nr:hypothetical protein [Streptomyces niveus]EST25768.1 hypothetical protein M877_21540 [Streptomyces niveus NCIMB 11891]
MDAGIAALLGAGIGSVATLGATILSGRAQARAQHEQWLRQHRRDAYAGYLSALHDRDIAMDSILDALRQSESELSNVDENVQRFVTLAREVHRRAEVVILEGPHTLAEAAGRITHASEELSQVMRRMVEDARTSQVSRQAQDRALAAERERDLYQTIKDFRLTARTVLGNTD